VFDLWQLWILAAGIAVVSGGSRRKAGAVLVLLWLMWIVGGAILETVSAGVPAPMPAAT
jgi:hypothetical protein